MTGIGGSYVRRSQSPTYGSPGLSPDDTRVWTLIADRHGRAAAISAADLARETGLNDRAVRKIVKALIEQHGAPIASSPHPPAGYYLPETLDEIRETLDSLKGRALSILTRMARLRRMTLPEMVGQLQLEMERDDAA
jgi:biotin operon repressor